MDTPQASELIMPAWHPSEDMYGKPFDVKEDPNCPLYWDFQTTEFTEMGTPYECSTLICIDDMSDDDWWTAIYETNEDYHGNA
jgi:hypothetical protein